MVERASIVLAVFVVLSACEGTVDPPGPNASVLIQNASQYQLRELRIHDVESYSEAANVLTEAMAIDAELMFYGNGEWYVTVLREKSQGGPILAFTTGEPLTFVRNRGYRLEILDEAFRMWDEQRREPGSGPIIGDPKG